MRFDMKNCLYSLLIVTFCVPALASGESSSIKPLSAADLDRTDTLSPVQMAKFDGPQNVVAQKAALEVARLSMDLNETNPRITDISTDGNSTKGSSDFTVSVASDQEWCGGPQNTCKTET